MAFTFVKNQHQKYQNLRIGKNPKMPILVILKPDPMNGLCWNHAGCLIKMTDLGAIPQTLRNFFQQAPQMLLMITRSGSH